MAKFYSNENFPYPVVEALRRLGHDVMTVLEAGNAEQSIPDDEVLAFAHESGRAVLTINRRHFVSLHRKGNGHSGIIVCTFDPDFDAQAERIHVAVQNSEQLDGELIRINRPQAAET